MYCYKCGLPINEEEPHRSISINRGSGVREFYDFHVDCVVAHGEVIAKSNDIPTYDEKANASDRSADEILEENEIGEFDE